MSNDYPNYKKWLWRFVRTGISGGASAVVALNVVLHFDLSNVQVYTTSLLAAFVSGFISAVALALRDTFGSEYKESMIDKMPL
jgi:hypothetical protein